jgi:hypothetical protein
MMHLSQYVLMQPEDEKYLHQAGNAVLQSSNQTLTLGRIAQHIANRPDNYLIGMVRALALTDGVVPFDMYLAVSCFRALQA